MKEEEDAGLDGGKFSLVALCGDGGVGRGVSVGVESEVVGVLSSVKCWRFAAIYASHSGLGGFVVLVVCVFVV